MLQTSHCQKDDNSKVRVFLPNIYLGRPLLLTDLSIQLHNEEPRNLILLYYSLEDKVCDDNICVFQVYKYYDDINAMDRYGS
jgi:hypothetical protein